MDSDKFINQSNRLEIVPMTEQDLGDVMAVERTSFHAPWTREMFEKELANRSSRPLVFKKEGKPVGYMVFWLVMDEAHLMTVAVHPAHRSRGIGRAMLEYLESQCRAQRLQTIVLEVARGNAAARHLYRTFGFQSVGFRRNYYPGSGEDAVVMIKRLNEEEPNIESETP